jgi:hypothetical protein
MTAEARNETNNRLRMRLERMGQIPELCVMAPYLVTMCSKRGATRY